MKTYVLTLSQVFPATHPRKGENTMFLEKFFNGLGKPIQEPYYDPETLCNPQKLHTIRANYPLWQKRFEQIERGEACLSIRQWSGKPYHSPQREIARLTKEDGIGLQKLVFDPDSKSDKLYNPLIFSKGLFRSVSWSLLANNDGLRLKDWSDWFKGYDISKPLAIIHFTKFRY